MALCWVGFGRWFELLLGFLCASYLNLDFSSFPNTPEVCPDLLFTVLCSFRAFQVAHIFSTVLVTQVTSKITTKSRRNVFKMIFKFVAFFRFDNGLHDTNLDPQNTSKRVSHFWVRAFFFPSCCQQRAQDPPKRPEDPQIDPQELQNCPKLMPKIPKLEPKNMTFLVLHKGSAAWASATKSAAPPLGGSVVC